jgi:hypothetical protein
VSLSLSFGETHFKATLPFWSPPFLHFFVPDTIPLPFVFKQRETNSFTLYLALF